MMAVVGVAVHWIPPHWLSLVFTRHVVPSHLLWFLVLIPPFCWLFCRLMAD
jgi:hypothetical protein